MLRDLVNQARGFLAVVLSIPCLQRFTSREKVAWFLVTSSRDRRFCSTKSQTRRLKVYPVAWAERFHSLETSRHGRCMKIRVLQTLEISLKTIMTVCARYQIFAQLESSSLGDISLEILGFNFSR